MSEKFGVKSRCKTRNAKMIRLLEHTPSGVCPVCGEAITDDSVLNVDHAVPRACVKWALGMSSDELSPIIDALGSRDNILIMHEKCNSAKGAAFHDLDSLNITDNAKSGISRVMEIAAPAILRYMSVLGTILRRNNFRCKSCGIALDSTTAVLRRLNHSKPRSLSNVTCLCNRCSILGVRPDRYRSNVRKYVHT